MSKLKEKVSLSVALLILKLREYFWQLLHLNKEKDLTNFVRIIKLFY
jgi:hypothetical protein